MTSIIRMDVLVRGAAPADVPEILELWKRSVEWQKKYDARFAAKKDAEHVMAKWLIDHMGLDDAQILVAVGSSGRIFGYASAVILENQLGGFAQKYGYILDMSSLHHKRGIAEALGLDLERWYKSRGIRHVEVEVSMANPAGNALAKHWGFTPLLTRYWKDVS